LAGLTFYTGYARNMQIGVMRARVSMESPWR
jgi:hypothetical protein